MLDRADGGGGAHKRIDARLSRRRRLLSKFLYHSCGPADNDDDVRAEEADRERGDDSRGGGLNGPRRRDGRASSEAVVRLASAAVTSKVL